MISALHSPLLQGVGQEGTQGRHLHRLTVCGLTRPRCDVRNRQPLVQMTHYVRGVLAELAVCETIHQVLKMAHGSFVLHALRRKKQLHGLVRRGAIAHHEEKETKAVRSADVLRAPKVLHVVAGAKTRPQDQRADGLLHYRKGIGVRVAEGAPFPLQLTLNGLHNQRD